MAAGRKTGGRQKGVKNKATLQAETFTKEVIEATLHEGISPLEYMLQVMRTSNDTKRKDAMAVAAAAYIHPRLASIEANVKVSEHEEAVKHLHATVTATVEDHERPN